MLRRNAVSPAYSHFLLSTAFLLFLLSMPSPDYALWCSENGGRSTFAGRSAQTSAVGWGALADVARGV
eukprot:636143-Pleurochrysis_carterae.AAC.1